MKDLRKRFKISDAYLEEDKDIFFGREDEINRIYQLAGFESMVLLHGKKGVGKTSLVNAGLIPLLNNSGMFNVVKFDFKNILDINLSADEYLTSGVKKYIPSISYTDILFENSSDFWIKIKKIQSNPDIEKKLILVFDNIENVFLKSKKFIDDFFRILHEIISEELPEKYKTTVEKKLEQKSDLLTESGKKLLFKKPEIKIVFSICTENLNQLLSKINFLEELTKKSYELKYFNNKRAADVIKKIAGFSSKYNDRNNFSVEPFFIEDELLTENINNISSGNIIKPIELQILGGYLERNSLKFPDNITIEKIFNTQTDLFLNTLDLNLKNRLIDFSSSDFFINSNIYIRESEISELFPLIIENQNDLHNLLETSVDENSQKIISFKSQFLLESLKSFKLSGNEKEIEVIQKGNIFNRSKYLNLTILYVFLFAAAVILLFNYMRKQAKTNEIFAKSNMYSAYSFRYLNEDPTLSFRYAEYAYKLNKNNVSAYSALLNSYYKTEVFYAIVKNISNKFINSKMSSDSKKIAILSKQKESFLFEILNDKGDNIFTVKENVPVTVFGFSRYGEIFYYADITGKIHLYNFHGVKTKEIDAFDTPVWLIRFSPDLKSILVSSNYEIVKFDIENSQKVKILESDFDIYAADYSPDGKIIAVANDNKVKLYNVGCVLINDIIIADVNSYYQPIIETLEFSNDSKKILLAVNDLKGKNHLAELVDLQTNNITIFRKHSDWINTAHFSNDGDKIITSSQDKTSEVWLSTGEFVGVLQGHKSNVMDAVFTENANRIITVSSDKTIRSWRFGRLLNPLAEIENIDFACFSNTGLNIYTASDTMIQLRDLTGDVIKEFKGNKKRIKTVDISSDGKFILSAGKDKSVRVWKIESGTEFVQNFHKSKINAAVFTPDSNLVISGGADSSIIVWKPGKDNPEKIIKTMSEINSIAVSPDGKSILTAEASGKVISRTYNGEILFSIDAHEDQALTAVYSSDGKYFATTGKDAKAALWTKTGRLVKYFEGYENKVNSVEFSKDSKNILTASDDNTIKLYDISGNEIFKFKEKGKVKRATFSPDGNYIISSSISNGKKTGRLLVISAEKILELTNEVKIFGEFLKIDSLKSKEESEK